MPESSISDRDTLTPSSGRRVPWFGIFVVLLCVCIAGFYWQRTRLPATVVIAGGPAGGRYETLAQAFAEELERRLDVTVTVQATQGSLENLKLLDQRQVDLALYQSGTQQILDGEQSRAAEPAYFVSNLYSEYLIPIGSGATADAVLSHRNGSRWSCNDRLSGDYAMARLLLRHLGIDESSIEMRSGQYGDIPQQIAEGELDIGIVCCGLDAPVLREIVNSDATALIKIPAVDAFVRNNMILTRGEIPAGLFGTSPPVPSVDYTTVTLQAQLLANKKTSVRLVEEVAAIISDVEFQRRQGLNSLFAGGVQYATARPEFELHPGAAHVFFPELKPLINPDFVEGTEGLRSFLVSLFVAVWLLHRWWKGRQIRGQEHRLDRYIRDLLQLERDQMEVDGDGGPEQSETLQRLLDSVTVLRQDALSEFTAHELNEDKAVDSFIEMCHALSDKLNAKLLRHSILSLKAADHAIP